MKLTTPRLLLREFQHTDFDAVHAYAQDERVVRYQSWGPNSEEETIGFLATCIHEAMELPRRHFNLAVVLHDGHLIGGCRASLAGHAAEIGYSFHPDHWGQGLASEAVAKLLRFLFEEHAIHRVHATCSPENQASIRLLQRQGFQLEGRMRDHQRLRGQWRDSLLWSRLATDA